MRVCHTGGFGLFSHYSFWLGLGRCIINPYLSTKSYNNKSIEKRSGDKKQPEKFAPNRTRCPSALLFHEPDTYCSQTSGKWFFGPAFI